jgi:hypothetical protein
MRLDQQGITGTWQGPGTQRGDGGEEGAPERRGGDFMVVLLCVVVLAAMGYILYKVSPDGLGFGLFSKVDIEPPRLQAITPALSRILSTSADATPVNNGPIPNVGVQITVNGKALTPGENGKVSVVPVVKKASADMTVKRTEKAATQVAAVPIVEVERGVVQKAPAVRSDQKRPTTRPTARSTVPPKAEGTVKNEAVLAPVGNRVARPMAKPVAKPLAKPVAAKGGTTKSLASVQTIARPSVAKSIPPAPVKVSRGSI